MTAVRERYRPRLMGLNATFIIRGAQMGGFLAKTGGTITVTDSSGVLVDAIPVTAGIFTPIPIIFSDANGTTITLASGASGTLVI